MRKLHKFGPFQLLIGAFFLFIGLVALYPLWHTLIGSVIPYSEYMQKVLMLWPEHFTLEAYQFVFSQGKIFSNLKVTIFITVVGTLLNLLMITLSAYGLSKRYPGSRLVALLMIVTMFLGAGLIPNYILFRQIHLLNTVWVYIVPSLLNTFYVILMRTYFLSFPHELEESAYIDGSSLAGTFFRIVLPLSKPMLVTIALFTAVDYWNTFQASVYYVSDSSLKTLQDYLYMLLSDNAMNASGTGMQMMSTGGAVFSESIKLANTVVAIVPILLVYPFLQKHMSGGIMLGAIKG